MKLSRFLKSEIFIKKGVRRMEKPEYLKDNMIEIVLKEVRDDIL